MKNAPRTVENWRQRTEELVPAEGDESVGRACWEMLDQVIRYKISIGLHAQMKKFYSLRKNVHFKGELKGSGLVSANMLGTIHERTVNLLTDNNPTFEASKTGEAAEGENVDIILHASDHWWSETEQQSLLEESISNGELYGITFEKGIWNAKLNYPLGDFETIVIDPIYCGLYPTRAKEVEKAQGVLHYEPVSIWELKRRFPKFKDKIQADSEYIKELGDDRKTVTGDSGKSGGWKSVVSGIVRSIGGLAGVTESDESQETLLLEVWVKDYTRIKRVDQKPIVDDQQRETGQYEAVETEDLMFKYPGCIRRIRSCNGGELVLDDTPNPCINPQLDPEVAQKTYLYDNFPFSKTQSVKDTVTGWGIPLYGQLEGLQREFDIALSKFNVWGKASVPILLNPDDSGIANEVFEMGNKPIIANPADYLISTAIRWVDPPPVPGDILKAIEIYKDLIYQVAGAFDLDQAQNTGRNVIAYKAIAALLERTTTMLRGKVRAYGKMIRTRGRMYLSFAQNFYERPRWISYSEDGEDVSVQVGREQLMFPANLKVVSGSTMPVSRIQRREEALELFKMQAIDLDELHARLETPNRKAVINRMKEGPIGAFVQRLGAMGIPPELLQLFAQLGQMDDKAFQKKAEKGEIPQVGEVLQAMSQEGPPEDPEKASQAHEADAKVQEIMAKADKLRAEIDLVREQIRSEQVDQSVKLSGVDLDMEKIKIERAKVINEMGKLGEEDYGTKKGGQGPFRERGMSSNNQEA
uniref:Portal protein n=1 Tax=viral metagenome TaxID=1070528 RepID=A0A6H1ZRY3_9ZZZZ